MQRTSRLGMLVLANCASLGLSPHAAAQGDLFVYENATQRLPDDPLENVKDTLGLNLVDVDGDGDLDIYLAEGSASAAAFADVLWINDGTGRFTDESAARLPAIVANSVRSAFADLDGDGDLDGIVPTLTQNVLLINDGAGFFNSGALPQAAPPGSPGFAVPFPPFFVEVTTEAKIFDVDGDGDPDVVLANENPFFAAGIGPAGDFNRLLINDGSGTFTDESAARLPRELANTNGHAVGDIDGDGDMDLIESNVGSQNRVLVNDGAGFFSDETAARIPVDADSTRFATLGDVDGDGDLDLALGNTRGQQNRLLLNDGSGVFVDVTATNLPADSSTTNALVFEDLDGDDDLDLFVASSGDFVFGHGFLGEPNRLLFNDGSGVFTDSTFPRLELRDSRSTAAAFGDLDGDGRRDLVVANSGGVDQPNLPPPDGVEELFLRRDCDAEPVFCLQQMVDGVRVDVSALDPAPFPAGDMTSQSQRINEVRKRLLERTLRFAQQALVAGRAHDLALIFFVVRALSDGDPIPRDWVAGESAERIAARAEFALRVLRGR